MALTKPVLLDETGQNMVAALNAIAEALNSGQQLNAGDLAKLIYPIGFLYFSSIPIDLNIIFPGTTWEQRPRSYYTYYVYKRTA